MKRVAAIRIFSVLLLLLGGSQANACSVCFGDPNSPMGKGLGLGVIALLMVVMTVLGVLASFFVFLARRAKAVALKEAGSALSSDGSEV